MSIQAKRMNVWICINKVIKMSLVHMVLLALVRRENICMFELLPDLYKARSSHLDLLFLGRHGILIFSCLLFVLFEKICSIKTWWFCLIPIIVLHYGCVGDFFPRIICIQQVVEMGCFTIKKVSNLKCIFIKSVFWMLLVLQNS